MLTGSAAACTVVRDLSYSSLARTNQSSALPQGRESEGREVVALFPGALPA
jgi:hypothetical protein